MSSISSFIPIDLVITEWPSDLFVMPNALYAVGLSDYYVELDAGTALAVGGTVIIDEEIIFDLPFIPGCSIALLYDGSGTQFDFELGIIQQEFHLSLKTLSVSFLVQNNLLRTVEITSSGDGFSFEEIIDEDTGEPEPFHIRWSGIDLNVTSEPSFGVAFSGGAPTFEIKPFTIGKSGIVVDISSFSMIFSQENADGATSLPEDFDRSRRGVWIDSASVYLPENIAGILPTELSLDNAFIGSGGLCGEITGTWINSFNEETGEFTGDGVGKLYDIPFAIKEVGIEFQQNTLVEGSISGTLMLPYFDAPLDLALELTNEGDFSVSLVTESTDGILKVETSFVILELSAIEFSKEGDEFFVICSGSLQPNTEDLENSPEFEIKNLRISSTGKVEVEGGWMDLSTQMALDFKGFSIEVTRLGFGRDELVGGMYNWIGFSGGIQIVEGLPLEGGVEGLKLMWNTEDATDVKVQISGINLGFEIEDVLTFDGEVQFIDWEEDGVTQSGMAGGVTLTIHPLNDVGIEAKFLAGRKHVDGESFNFFYLFMDVNLPAGIPVVPPALEMIGLSGLFGYNMTPAKSDDEAWFVNEDTSPGYYLRSPKGIRHFSKWKGQKGALAFGAGVTLRTTADAGFSMTAKVLLVLLIPGPVIMIEGMATLLTNDDLKPEDYPFRVLAVIDTISGTFLFNVEAKYLNPADTGELVDVYGVAEVFFSFGNSRNWHIYLGKDEPEAARIRASVMDFLKGNAYLMVDNTGFKMGLWIGYKMAPKKYGPLKVQLEAWFEGKLSVSFAPIQAKGSIVLNALATLSCGPISLGVGVEAGVSVEAPRPLLLEAYLKVQLKTPFGNPKAKVELKWEKQGTPPYPMVLQTAGMVHPKVSEDADLAILNTYNLDGDGNYESTGGSINESTVEYPLVPMDSRIVLTFAKPVADKPGLGAHAKSHIEPETVGKYAFRYAISGLELLEDQSGSWVTVAGKDDSGTTFPLPLQGVWQAVEGTDGVENTQLLLWADTPFDRYRNLESQQSTYNSLFAGRSGYPCDRESEASWTLLNFEHYEVGARFNPFFEHADTLFYSDFPMDIVAHSSPEIGTNKGLNPLSIWEKDLCVNLDSTYLGSTSGYRYIDSVKFLAGSANPLQFEANPSGGKRIRFNGSYSGGSHSPMVIEFRNSYFPNRPEEVRIDFRFPDQGYVTFRAINVDGSSIYSRTFSNTSPFFSYSVEIKSAVHGYGVNPQIDRIEIESSPIYINSVCYSLVETTNEAEMLITLPEDMGKTRLFLDAAASGTVRAYSASRSLITSQSFAGAAGAPIELTQNSLAIRTLTLTGTFTLLQLATLSEAAYAADSRRIESGLVTSSQLDELWDKHWAEILKPDTKYKISINTQAERKKNSGEWKSQAYTEYLYFQTGGPPGTVELDSEAKSYPKGGPLANLQAYVGRTIPASSTPDKPVVTHYRSYDVGLEFNEDYVEQLYLSAGFDLRLRLYDTNGNPIKDEGGTVLDLPNAWGQNPYLRQTKEEFAYTTMLGRTGCYSVSESASATETFYEEQHLLLPASAQFKAVFRTDDDDELYNFHFRTSRYAHFLHHMQSFVDVAWDEFALMGAPATYDIDLLTLDTALTSGLAPHIQFAQLWDFFQLAQARPLPAQTELALLRDHKQNYGWVFESPEPMDTDRVEMSLRYVPGGHPVEPIVPAALKLLGRGSETIAGKSIEYLEVLVQTGMDLEGYRLTFSPLSALETVADWYVFPEDSQYETGAVIRLFAGDPVVVSSLVTEHAYVHVDSIPLLLDGTADQIQVFDADNQLIQDRMVYAASAYVPLPLELRWNGDGSRAFLFVPSASAPYSALTPGQYALEVKFKRDLGRPEVPVLKRYGYEAEEVTQLVFSVH